MVGFGALGQNLNFASVDGNGALRFVWRDRSNGGLYVIKSGSNIIPYSAVGVGAIDVNGFALNSPNDPNTREIHFNVYTKDGKLWWGWLQVSPWSGSIGWTEGPGN